MKYHTTLTWTRRTDHFNYETFDRTHWIKFGGGSVIEASSAPEFLGKAEHVNPEELYLAALSSCHLLTFLAIAAKSRFSIDDYRDEAEAELSPGPEGKLYVSRVHLRPWVLFCGDPLPDRNKIISLHEKAHRNCFIASSVKSEILVVPKIDQDL